MSKNGRHRSNTGYTLKKKSFTHHIWSTLAASFWGKFVKCQKGKTALLIFFFRKFLPGSSLGCFFSVPNFHTPICKYDVYYFFHRLQQSYHILLIVCNSWKIFVVYSCLQDVFTVTTERIFYHDQNVTVTVCIVYNTKQYLKQNIDLQIPEKSQATLCKR